MRLLHSSFGGETASSLLPPRIRSMKSWRFVPCLEELTGGEAHRKAMMLTRWHLVLRSHLDALLSPRGRREMEDDLPGVVPAIVTLPVCRPLAASAATASPTHSNAHTSLPCLHLLITTTPHQWASPPSCGKPARPSPAPPRRAAASRPYRSTMSSSRRTRPPSSLPMPAKGVSRVRGGMQSPPHCPWRPRRWRRRPSGPEGSISSCGTYPHHSWGRDSTARARAAVRAASVARGVAGGTACGWRVARSAAVA